MADDQAAQAAAEATTAEFRAAGERADLAAFLETLSADVQVRSPISFRTRFEGLDDVAPLMRAAFDVIEDIEYFEDLGTARARVLVYRARIGGQPVEGVIVVRLDERAKVTEMKKRP